MIGLMELKGIVGQAAVTITAVENKEKTVQIDLCDIVNFGGNKIAWRGYDVYGCVWPSMVRIPTGPWCHTWNDVNWSTKPNYKITNRNIITNKIKIFRGHGVTKEHMNPLLITISPLNKMDIWVTIGVDVTGTDPMGLIWIIVSQTGITAATPLIRLGALEERKVIVKELGQVTIEDTFAI